MLPPPSPPTPALTELLHRSRQGDKQAFDALLPFVHAQLESLASVCLRSSRRDQTLRTTALVNEAYLKLVGAPLNFEDRSHFFAVAARKTGTGTQCTISFSGVLRLKPQAVGVAAEPTLA